MPTTVAKRKVKKVIKGLKKASKTHAKQAKTLEAVGFKKGGSAKKKSSGKKDACYHKVKASAKVWPSAYASGRLVQCRKVGAANYGKSKKRVKKSIGGPIRGQGAVMRDRLR